MYNSGFDFKNQDHAANGYVLLYTNPRGSSGYGSSFGNEIKNAYPGKDLDDLMAGVDEVIARGYIDERNLFVYGGSGGGVLTSWDRGEYRPLHRRGLEGAGDELVQLRGNDGRWRAVYRNFEKLPWDDPEEHLRRSTLMYVGNVTTPTMLMTGEKDPPHPDGADRAVLQGAQDAEDPDGHGPPDRTVGTAAAAPRRTSCGCSSCSASGSSASRSTDEMTTDNQQQ